MKARDVPRLALVLAWAPAVLPGCGGAGDDAPSVADGDHLEAARSLYQEGDYDSALTRYTMAVEGGSERAVAYNERGMTYAARGEFERAEADLDSALSVRPSYTMALSNLAVVHLRLGRLEEAMAELDSLASLRPEDAKVYYDRAHAHERMGHPDRALEDLNRAIRLDSSIAGAYMSRGAILARRDDLEGAAADFEKAVDLSGSEAARKNLGIARLEMGEYGAALEIFDELLGEAPLQARYHVYRGRAHRGLGRDGEARTDFQRALELTGNPGLRQQAIRALREMEGGGP